MMTRDEALQKAAKLLRLAESQNPHEAALAAARAQELLDRYELDRATVELDAADAEPAEAIVDFGLRGGGDPLALPPGVEINTVGKTWPRRLASVLARANGCFIYYGYADKHRMDVHVVGRPSDVAKVRYLYTYLAGEVVRLARRDCVGASSAWTRNYQVGVVDAIGEQLRRSADATREQLRREAEGQTQALVKVERAIVVVAKRRDDAEAFANAHHNFRVARGATMTFQPGARAAGRAAGREIRVSSARGALGGGLKGLNT